VAAPAARPIPGSRQPEGPQGAADGATVGDADAPGVGVTLGPGEADAVGVASADAPGVGDGVGVGSRDGLGLGAGVWDGTSLAGGSVGGAVGAGGGGGGASSAGSGSGDGVADGSGSVTSGAGSAGPGWSRMRTSVGPLPSGASLTASQAAWLRAMAGAGTAPTAERDREVASEATTGRRAQRSAHTSTDVSPSGRAAASSAGSATVAWPSWPGVWAYAAARPMRLPSAGTPAPGTHGCWVAARAARLTPADPDRLSSGSPAKAYQ
jgi:hypothetical protein